MILQEKQSVKTNRILRILKREVLFESQITFYATNFLISEIYKHFDKLLAASKLDESDFHIYFNSFFHKIQFIPIDFIATESRKKAYELQWTSV